MSNQLYMDEFNGNGIYANKLNNINQSTVEATTNLDNNPTITAAATTHSNINHIMNTAGAITTITTTTITNGTNGVTTTTTTTTTITSSSSSTPPPLTNAPTPIATTTANHTTLPASASTEDLSQSLSEYTDADESISAPTEFLAEFLSAVMLKDYKKALKYCKLILQYEPNNTTAKEFYPLILDKLQASSDSDENYNKSSSPEYVIDLQSDENVSDEAAVIGGDDEFDGLAALDDNYHSNGSNISSGSAGESLSMSMDEDDDEIEEDDDDDNDDDDEDVENVDDDQVDEDDEGGGDSHNHHHHHININNICLNADENVDNNDDDDDDASSSGDELPIDDTNDVCIGLNLDLASHSSHNSSSGAENRSRSDNTTHSYSSLLLEEEDDMLPINVHLTKARAQENDLDVSNGNKVASTSCSDSESPTEPLTQRLAAILLSKCGVSSKE